MTEPIELVKNNDGKLEIENGNYRLLIAKMFNLKTIPVKYTKRLFEILEKIIDVSYNQIGSDKYGNKSTSGKISGNNAQSEYFIRSGNGIIEYAKNGRTDTRDARLHNKVRGYNNRSSNSTATSRNTLWGQELENGSFSLNQKQENAVNVDLEKVEKNSIEEKPLWQKFLDDNHKTYGTRTKMSDLKKNNTFCFLLFFILFLSAFSV